MFVPGILTERFSDVAKFSVFKLKLNCTCKTVNFSLAKTSNFKKIVKFLKNYLFLKEILVYLTVSK